MTPLVGGLLVLQTRAPLLYSKSLGFEAPRYEWIQVAYDAPDEPWIRLKLQARKLSAEGKGAAYRAKKLAEFDRKPPTTQDAYFFAIVALEDYLAGRSGRARMTALAPAWLALNYAPVVHAPETARAQILLHALALPGRMDVVRRVTPFVRRFTEARPDDLVLRSHAVYLVNQGYTVEGYRWSLRQSQEMVRRWPEEPQARHVLAATAFAVWSSERTEANRRAALVAAEDYRSLLQRKRLPLGETAQAIAVLKRASPPG